MKKLFIFTILLVVFVLSACNHNSEFAFNEQDNLQLTNQSVKSASTMNNNSPSSPTTNSISPKKDINQLTIKLEKGNIVLQLFPEQAPQTVKNFVTKAQSGFYNNLTFHRVEDWVVQGGDPLGNGTGGGNMPTEINNIPFTIGSLGVARGQDIKISNDSQFFICTKDCSWLNQQYTNFGKVIQGMEIVNNIAIGDKITAIE